MKTDLEEVAGFHGHTCPGLALGYRAAQVALGEFPRPADEEVAVIVENDSCAVDAIQYMMGATFGKGNLIYRDHGKHAYTFITPEKSLRVALKPGIMQHGGSREERIEKILGMPTDDLFKVEWVDTEKPPTATIHESIVCEKCNEPVMETRARIRDGQIVCIPCTNQD